MLLDGRAMGIEAEEIREWGSEEFRGGRMLGHSFKADLALFDVLFDVLFNA